MSTGAKFRKFGFRALISAALLCLTIPGFASQSQQPHQKKVAKKAELPPLPSGPTGQAVPQVPLDSIGAVPPQVVFEHNQLTIIAPNSTLADILRAVRKQTGADIEVPAAPERVVTHLGPGPARDVVSELLNGSRFNYILLGSPSDDSVLTRVVLVPKGPDNVGPMNPGAQPGNVQASIPAQPENPPDPDTAEDSSMNNNDNAVETPAAAEPDQPPPNSDQNNAVKTPQQMLQEMQQRQMQMQQQQQQGVPGSGMPPHPPQQN